jgi:hypothetical protein
MQQSTHSKKCNTEGKSAEGEYLMTVMWMFISEQLHVFDDGDVDVLLGQLHMFDDGEVDIHLWPLHTKTNHEGRGKATKHVQECTQMQSMHVQRMHISNA